MKKIVLFATAAFLISGVAFAQEGDGKKGKKCCSKESKCCEKKKAVAKKA
jgi:hypothetical protein